MKKMTTSRQIGQAIRKQRANLAMTQQQLADAAGVSRGFINRIEKGASAAVYPEKLLSILTAAGLSLYIEAPEEACTDNGEDSLMTTEPAQTTRTSPLANMEDLQIDPALLKQRLQQGH